MVAKNPHTVARGDLTQDECFPYILDFDRVRDKALMGGAHMHSAMGLFIFSVGILAFLDIWNITSIGISMFIMAVIVVMGASRMNDLDNTRSKAESSLGITGSLLSAIFRGSSLVVQKTIRTSKDPSDPNPHRGFWHSFAGAATMGIIVFSFSIIGFTIDIPSIGEVKIGNIITYFICVALCFIAFADLELKMSKGSKKFNEIIAYIINFVIVALLFATFPSDAPYEWIGFAVFIGMSIHILGDALTKMGVPMFMPVTAFFTGKAWWMTRFATFSADSESLNKTISIISFILAILGIIGILIGLAS